MLTQIGNVARIKVYDSTTVRVFSNVADSVFDTCIVPVCVRVVSSISNVLLVEY